MSTLPSYTDSGARISPDGRYRYSLWRTWDAPTTHRVVWIMLNPSTADGRTDDATIRRCVLLACAWGYGGIDVGNLFAYRARDPRELPVIRDHAVGPDNIVTLASLTCGTTAHTDPPRGHIVVAAWGTRGVLHDQDDRIVSWLRSGGVPIHSVGVTRDNHPRHPLYVRGDVQPLRWPQWDVSARSEAVQ